MDKTVAKALGLIEALSLSSEARGVTELADELDLTKANVHRLLKTLATLGFVRQAPGSARYELSLKLWEVASRVVHRLDLTAAARPVLHALCDETGESVQLAVRDGDSIVYVDKADSPQPVRATTQIGSRVPAHCVSTGKAILAHSDVAFSALKFPLPSFTPRTKTTRAELQDEFAQARRDGYAINRGEWRLGIWGVAAPIRDERNEVVAAVGAWGPEVRFRSAKLKAIGPSVVAAARRISIEIGHVEQSETGALRHKRGRYK